MSRLGFRRALWILGAAGLALVSVTGYFRVVRRILPEWDARHARLLAGQMFEPEQYSVLAPGLAELVSRASGLEPSYAYLLERFVLLFIVALVFVRFSRRWLSELESLLALLGFFFLYQLTLYAHFQPAEELNLVFFLAGFVAIERGRFGWLLAVVALGTLNKQTVAFLIPIYWTHQALRGRGLRRDVLIEILALVAGFLIVRHGLRALIGPRPYPASMLQLGYNLRQLAGGDPRAWYFALPSLLPLLLILASWRRQPLLVRALVPSALLFVALHLIVTPVIDFRAHMPLAFVTLPAAILFLRPYLDRGPLDPPT